MQSINVCGMTIAYNNCNYAAYMEIKTRLEQCFQNLYYFITHNEITKYPVCHYIRTKENVVFSVYIDDKKQIHAGIYDKQTKSIITDCSFEDVRSIDDTDIKILQERIENAVKSKVRVNMSIMINAWEECLREQELSQQESDINYEDDLER